MPKERGFSLVSQQIRDLISDGFLQVPEQNLDQGEFFSDSGLERRIQPASFEPSVADEVFILDTEGYGLLRPRREESVYRTLLQLPMRKRSRKNIADGFELKTGFTYLVKLNERLSSRNLGNHKVS